MDYKDAYLKLFNEITDLIEQLKKIQQEAEDIVIEDENNNQFCHKICHNA